jgi:protein-L-isoaspartate(D-aspartate) O-methyltransferase
MLNDAIFNLIAQNNRHNFVPPAYRQLAYTEMNIPIGHDQVMLKPNEEARLLEALAIQPHEKVLELGTGTGYLTALLAQQAQQVVTVDYFAEFTHRAQGNLQPLNLTNITYVTEDGCQGLNQYAPFDVICLTAAVPKLPQAFLEQLTPKGRLFAIIGTSTAAMTATLVSKNQHQTNLFETDIPTMIHAPQPGAFTF